MKVSTVARGNSSNSYKNSSKSEQRNLSPQAIVFNTCREQLTKRFVRIARYYELAIPNVGHNANVSADGLFYHVES